MTNSALREFTKKISTKGRISFGDVRRLERDILSDGLVTREEAELLIALDKDVGKADAAWRDYLVRTIVDFVVWGERPTGQVDEGAANWLADALSSGGPLTRTGRLILSEIAREVGSAAADLPDGGDDHGSQEMPCAISDQVPLAA